MLDDAGDVYLRQTVGGADGVHFWETDPGDSSRRFHNPLEGLLLSLGAAGKPHQESLSQYTAQW